MCVCAWEGCFLKAAAAGFHGSCDERADHLLVGQPCTTFTTLSHVFMLSRLPPEVSLDIFGLLELRHLARCLRVCREWHHFLIKAPSLWNHLNLRRHLVSGLDATTFETYQYALKNYIMWAGSHLKTLRLDFELSEVYGTLALQLVATHGCKRLERLGMESVCVCVFTIITHVCMCI